MRGKSLVILMKALPVLKPFALISYRWRWRQKAPIRIFSLKHTDSHQHKNTFALLHVPKRFHTPSAASRVRSHQLGYITVVCCCDTKLNLVFLFALLCAAVLPSSRPQVRKLLCAWICVCLCTVLSTRRPRSNDAFHLSVQRQRSAFQFIFTQSPLLQLGIELMACVAVYTQKFWSDVKFRESYCLKAQGPLEDTVGSR